MAVPTVFEKVSDQAELITVPETKNIYIFDTSGNSNFATLTNALKATLFRDGRDPMTGLFTANAGIEVTGESNLNGITRTKANLEIWGSNAFASGIWECNFTMDLYRMKTQNIIADMNKTVQIQMSKIGGLTEEEHDWLEAIYECIINGNGCAP